MTEQRVSPLRRRMIEDMTIRKFAQKTQHDYVQRVKNFAKCLGRSPSTPSKPPTPRLRPALNPRSKESSTIRAPVAVAACASSRPSCVGSNQRTDPPRCHQRSGSIHHEATARARNTQTRSPSLLPFSQQRESSCPHANFLARNNASASDRGHHEPCFAFTTPIGLT